MKKITMLLFVVNVIFVANLFSALSPDYVLNNGSGSARGKRIYIAIDPMFITKAYKGTMDSWSWNYSYANSGHWDNCISPLAGSSCWDGTPVKTTTGIFAVLRNYLSDMRYFEKTGEYDDANCGDSSSSFWYTVRSRVNQSGCDPTKSSCVCGADTGGLKGAYSGYHVANPSNFMNGVNRFFLETRSYRGFASFSSWNTKNAYWNYVKGFPWLRHLSTRLLAQKSDGSTFHLSHFKVNSVPEGNIDVGDISFFINIYFSMLPDYMSSGSNIHHGINKYNILSYFERIPVVCKYFGASDNNSNTQAGMHSVNSFLGKKIQTIMCSNGSCKKSKVTLDILATGRINSSGYTDNIFGYFDLLDNGPGHVPGYTSSSYSTRWYGISGMIYNSSYPSGSYEPDTLICPIYELDGGGSNYEMDFSDGSCLHPNATGVSNSPRLDWFTNQKFCRYSITKGSTSPHKYFYTKKLCFSDNDCSKLTSNGDMFSYILKDGYKDSKTKTKRTCPGYGWDPNGRYLKYDISLDSFNIFPIPQTFLGLQIVTGSTSDGSYGTFFSYPKGMGLHNKVYYFNGSNIGVKTVNLANFYMFHPLHSLDTKYSLVRKRHIGAYAHSGYMSSYNTPLPVPNTYTHYYKNCWGNNKSITLYGSVHGNNWVKKEVRPYYRNGNYDGWNEGTTRHLLGDTDSSHYWRFFIKDSVPLMNPYSIINVKVEPKLSLLANFKVWGISVTKMNMSDLPLPNFAMPLDLLALVTGDPQPGDGITPTDVSEDSVYEAKKNSPCMQDADGDGWLDCYMPLNNTQAKTTNYGTIDYFNKDYNQNVKFDVGLFPIGSEVRYNASSYHDPIFFDLRFLAEARNNLSCLNELPVEPTNNEKDNYYYENLAGNSNDLATLFPSEADGYAAVKSHSADLSIILSKYAVRHVVYNLLKSGMFCKDIDYSSNPEYAEQLQVKNLKGMFPFLNSNFSDDSYVSIHVKPTSVPVVTIYGSSEGPNLPDLGYIADSSYTKIHVSFYTKVSLWLGSLTLVSYKVNNHFVVKIPTNKSNSVGVSVYYDPEVEGFYYKISTISHPGDLGEIIPVLLSSAFRAGLNLNINPLKLYNPNLNFRLETIPVSVKPACNLVAGSHDCSNHSYAGYKCNQAGNGRCELLKLGLTITGKFSVDDFVKLTKAIDGASFSPGYFNGKESRFKDFTVGDIDVDKEIFVNLKNYDSVINKHKVNFEIDKGVSYIYSIDNGFWSPVSNQQYLKTPFLLDGKHTLKIRAVNGNKYGIIDSYKFEVDTIPPELKIQRTGDSLNIFVSDNNHDANKLIISMSVDNGEYRIVSQHVPVADVYGYNEHIIRVKVMDTAGNVTGREMVWQKSNDKGFGCSSSDNKVSEFLFIFILIYVFLLYKREDNYE